MLKRENEKERKRKWVRKEEEGEGTLRERG